MFCVCVAAKRRGCKAGCKIAGEFNEKRSVATEFDGSVLLTLMCDAPCNRQIDGCTLRACPPDANKYKSKTATLWEMRIRES
jgi:hypothetical protein